MTAEAVHDRYRLGRLIGAGGMGRVWQARDEVLGRDVALKEILLPAELIEGDRDALRHHMLREGRAAARLSHPAVARVYDTFESDGRAWIVMEYVPSRSLQEVLDSDGPLPPRRVAEIGVAVLAALTSAHAAGVRHRDVKPANVLLADDGRVVLTDFGVAAVDDESLVTSSGLVMGSPQFMAPERVRDGATSEAGDLWSLGATLYAAVEGHAPYTGHNVMETITAIVSAPPRPPERAAELTPVLNGLLRRSPDDRIDAEETRRLLLTALHKGTSRRRLLRPPGRRNILRRGRSRSAVTPPPPSPDELAGSAAQPAPPPDIATQPAPPAPDGAAPAAAPQPGLVPRPVSSPPGAAPAPPSPQPGAARRRWPAPMIAAGVAVLLLVVAVLAWTVLRPTAEKPDRAAPARTPASPASATASPSPSAASSATAGAGPGAAPSSGGTGSASAGAGGESPASGGKARPALPAGWIDYHDPTGFQVYVPQGWNRSKEGSIVYFRASGRVLGIDQTDEPQWDPVADWRGKADYRVARGDFPDYHEIHIRAVQYYLKAADWEFTFERGGTRQHVNNRGVVTSKHQAYGFYWQTTDAGWQAAQEDLRLVFDSFRPAS